MTKVESLPDLGGAMAAMRIWNDLYAIYPGSNLFLLAIRASLENKRPLSVILATILHHYYEAPEETLNAIGEDLMNRIKELLKNKKHG